MTRSKTVTDTRSPAAVSGNAGLAPREDSPAENLAAEEALLGALMDSPDALTDLRTRVEPEDFSRPAHRRICRAIYALHDRGDPVDVITTAGELKRTDLLEGVGGELFLYHLWETLPTSASASYYAREVIDQSKRRKTIAVLRDLTREARSAQSDPETFQAEAAQRMAALAAGAPAQRSREIDGAAFAFGDAASAEPVWGRGSEVLWAAGEPLLIVGPDGSGKTTLGLWLVLALMGLTDELLRLPVVRADRRVGLIAADRPAQISRRLKQMVSQEEGEADLRERLLVHRGLLEFDLVEDPRALAGWASSRGLSAVVLDSLGHVVSAPSKDEVGSAIARAVGHVMDAGIELAILYHPRKATPENKKPTSLADVYGSRWITAMAGSVLSLWGDPGDPIIELRHLKQPQAEVGPFRIVVEAGGFLRVQEGTDPLELLRAALGGLTAKSLAEALYEGSARAQVEKARRRLQDLVSRGLAFERPGVAGRGGPSVFFATPPGGRQEPLA